MMQPSTTQLKNWPTVRKPKAEAARVRAASVVVVVGFSDSTKGGASDATVASHAS